MSASNLLKVFCTSLIIYLSFAMHIVLPTPGGTGLYLTPNILSWLFISLLLGAGLWQIALNKKIYLTRFHYVLGVGVFFLFIPFLYGTETSYFALPRMLAILASLLLLIALTQFNLTAKHKTLFLLCLLLGISIEGIIGLSQLFLLTPFDIQILGYTPLFGRPYGSFTQPNVMASFMATGIVLSLYLLLPENFKSLSDSEISLTRNTKLGNTKLSNVKPNNIRKGSWVKYFIFANLFFCSLLIVTLQSKTGYLALVISLLLFIPVFYKNRKTYFKPLVFIFFGILAGIIALKTIQQVDRGANLYKDMHRSTMYQVSAQMFIDKPILGYGYGNFRKAFLEYHSAKMKSDNQIKPPYDLNHPHNETLFWAVEGGIASVIALLVFAGAYLTLFKGQPYTKAIPLLALITPILIHSQTEFPFYHSITHWFYFIVFIWFAEQQTSTYKSIELQHTLGLKVLAIALPLFTSIFMITAIHTSLKMESLKANNYENIDGFNDIVNVIVWQHHIEVTKNTALLRQGFKNRNPKALVDYISWGFEFSKHTPKKELYQNMILAINTLEKNNVAINDNLKKTIYNDAVKLYPSFTNKN